MKEGFEDPAPGADAPLVLYVDDEWTNRVVFEKAFGGKFRVKSVGSGEEALELMASERIAVLVSDQRMPGMTGNELLAKAKRAHPDTVRMVVTAYSDLDPILRAVNEGLVTRYVIKPWIHSEFEKVLEWGMDVFIQGLETSSLHLRLMNAERLISVGSIAWAVFHDLENVVTHVKNNAERLTQLSSSLDDLKALLAASGSGIADSRRSGLEDLLEELPEIAEDMRNDSESLEGLGSSMQRLLNPRREEFHPAEPVSVVRNAIKIFRTVRRRLELAYEGPDSLSRVAMGRTELLQVLLNLISNSFRAYPKHPAPRGRILVQVEDEKGHIRFQVRDDGCGMKPGDVARAGTPFFTTRPEGAGLGLAQCKRLVEGHGGAMTIESEEGAGTTVVFTLPKA